MLRNIFNEVRNNVSHEETKRIRKKVRRIEGAYNVLKEKEQKSSTTSRQKICYGMMKGILRILLSTLRI